MNASPDTVTRIQHLILSLDEFNATDYPSYQVANLFNGLVDAAKAAMPSDPMVSVMTHAGIKGPTCQMAAGSMRTVLAQMMLAMGVDPPPTHLPPRPGITDDLMTEVW